MTQAPVRNQRGKEVHLGDFVVVCAWGGRRVVGVATGVWPDVKHGEPGIDYKTAADCCGPDQGMHEHWCYATQIESSYKPPTEEGGTS